MHPTTFVNKKAWNASSEDSRASLIVKDLLIPGQASIFSACCPVFIPKYRQAHLYSFRDKGGNGGKALELAFQDVRSAFAEFLTFTENSPFILAGHSQGTRHLIELIKENEANKSFMKNLVVAYRKEVLV